MALRAPIEVWTKILEEVIDVPEFFCPDPLATFGLQSWSKFSHEGYYWRAERWRNALRRVHSSWNAILDHRNYRHRFVRISDIAHGQLQEEEISWDMTLRITFGPEPGCRCNKYCKHWVHMWVLSEARETVARVSLEAMERILAVCHQKQNITLGWRLRMVDSLPRALNGPDILQILAGTASLTTIDAYTDWDKLSPYSTFLHLLHINFRIRAMSNTKVIPSFTPSFPHLTTLIIDSSFDTFPIEELHAPALRHLQICGYNAGDFQAKLDSLIAIIKVVGEDLSTLYYDGVFLDGVLPFHFWQLVPNLLRIRLNCYWTYPPPRKHPLRTIHIHTGILRNSLPDPSIPSYPVSFRRMPGWPLWSESTPTMIGTEHILAASEWSGRQFCITEPEIWDNIFFNSSYRKRCLSIAAEYDALGWVFTDYTGWTFGDFVVYLLKARREAKEMGIRNWVLPVCPPAEANSAINKLPMRRRRVGDRDRDILWVEKLGFERF